MATSTLSKTELPIIIQQPFKPLINTIEGMIDNAIEEYIKKISKQFKIDIEELKSLWKTKESKKRIKYNVDLLKEIIKRDNCKINLELYKNVTNRKVKIFFICSCGKKENKTFKILYEKAGGFCKYCTKRNTKEKFKKTMIERYNVEYAMQSENLMERHQNSCLENLGVKNPFQSEIIKEKRKKTNIKNLGYEHPAQSEIIRKKMQKTNLKRHGFKHAMQFPKIAEKCFKNSCKMKEYLMPSKSIILIQGYENYALDELFYNENIDENDILTSKVDVPEIWYEDKTHRYYTDIFIKSKNKCIEVKSDYTAEYRKDIIKLKEEAVIKAGYEYELRVYTREGIRIC